MKEFRILKKTRGDESRYFPQYRFSRFSGNWFFALIDGGNDWRSWIDVQNSSPYDLMNLAGTALMFKTQEEAENFIAHERAIDNTTSEEISV